MYLSPYSDVLKIFAALPDRLRLPPLCLSISCQSRSNRIITQDPNSALCQNLLQFWLFWTLSYPDNNFIRSNFDEVSQKITKRMAKVRKSVLDNKTQHFDNNCDGLISLPLCSQQIVPLQIPARLHNELWLSTCLFFTLLGFPGHLPIRNRI